MTGEPTTNGLEEGENVFVIDLSVTLLGDRRIDPSDFFRRNWVKMNSIFPLSCKFYQKKYLAAKYRHIPPLRLISDFYNTLNSFDFNARLQIMKLISGQFPGKWTLIVNLDY